MHRKTMEKIKSKYLVNEHTYSKNTVLCSESFSSGNWPATCIGSLDLF